MILNKVVIRGFRSVRDEQTLHIDRCVTVLIGANDHGKSNLLDALSALNDDKPFTPSDRNWDSADPELPRIDWYFELSDDERLALRDALPQPAQLTDVMPDAERAAVEEAGRQYDQQLQEIVALRHVVLVKAGESKPVDVLMPPGLREQTSIRKNLLKLRPRIERFETITKIPDFVTLEQLDTPEYEFMQGIFRQAGIWEGRKGLFTNNPRTRKLLADASERLTHRIREEWHQGRQLRFLLSHGDSGRIELQIEDPAVEGQYVLPSQRSTGFSAFFGMQMTLYARKEATQANSYIFAFDEPATSLHPHGQVNVQRVFETLARRNQLIYTTHSLFLINKNYPTRNRVVSKAERGTVIDHKPYSGNWRSVRSTLGLMFSNNLFVADTTLLVEGPSDAVYVTSILRTCNALHRIDADLNLFSIVDAGNSQDYTAMAKLMAEEGRRVVALVDGDKGGDNIKKQIERLKTAGGAQLDLDVIQLAEGSSTENYLPFQALLIESVQTACESLVSEGFRKGAQAPPKLQDALSAVNGNQTLGRSIEAVSAQVFEDGEPVSKLHVARIYDEKVEALIAGDQQPVPDTIAKAEELAAQLLQKLGLAEKIARESVLN